jgi:outer membrane lipoprotein-sorting protein
VIVYPDRERTEFKGSGSRTTQVNTGETGWVYDGDQDVIRVQTPKQIENFKLGLRTSLDSLLRGYWKGKATLSYVGRRQATLGKRNDVVKLTYEDGFAVEFEFADDGTPAKAIYVNKTGDGDVKNEDRYAQFVEIGGVKTPFIIDRLQDGEPVSRINYESMEFNKKVPDSVFAKPGSTKDAKKSVSL